MNMWKIIIITLSVFLLFALIYRFTKNKKPFRCALITMLSGVLALMAVNLAGSFFSVSIPVSILSIFIAVFLGAPGVTAILLLNLFF